MEAHHVDSGATDYQNHASLAASGWFAGWNKSRCGLLLLITFAGNVLVASIAWIIVRLVHS